MTDVNEDLIQNILSGSHLLETFTLHDCYGFKRLDSTSKSVKKFVISGDEHLNDRYGFAYLNAPNILSLKIQGSVMLEEILLDDLSSLVEAHLDYTEDDGGIWNVDYEEEILEAHILRLRHVKELKLGVMCSEVLSRLEAKGYIVPSNIKRAVNYDSEDDEGNLDSYMSDGP